MADRSISELPVAPHLTDAGLMVVYQNGKTQSIRGELIKQYAKESVSPYVEGAIAAAKSASVSAEQSRANAESAALSAETASAHDKAAANSAKEAEDSALHASESAEDALEQATTSKSWAIGGTGSREGEDADNAKYWADKAQAEADRATIPAVQGVYNVILSDRVSGARYALIVESGTLELLGVAETFEATQMTLVDGVTGVGYELIVEDGVLKMEEVQ